jgi:predicted SPOUT superfamily RNA methylase MTH1
MQTEELEKRGVDKVVCITPSSPEDLVELRAKPELQSPKVLCSMRCQGLTQIDGSFKNTLKESSLVNYIICRIRTYCLGCVLWTHGLRG